MSMSPRWDRIITQRGARGRHRWSRGGRLAFYTFMFVLILSLIAGAVLAYVAVRLGGDRQEIAELSRQAPNEPLNVLIVGSDSREGLSSEDLKKFDPEGTDRKTGRRADTIILVHVDEKRDEAVLVHFPRDLRVKLPGGKTGKINGAYQGGAGSVVKTVESFTGLEMHHYVEVDFTGFRSIVDALGGVDVFFERPIKDADSGLDVPKGCVRLKGDEALAFVRVRKIDNDFGRIARQQLFVKLMMDKLTRKGTLLNPIKVVKLVNLFSKNVTTDVDLGISDMKTLALRLRGFDSSKLDLRAVPSSGALIGGVSYVVANQRQSDAFFAAIRERKALPDYGRTGVSTLEPQDVEISVLNGTRVDGLAGKEADALKAAGFQVLATGGASPHAATTVYFKQGHDEKASLVAERYSAPVKAMPPAIVVETPVALVLGADGTKPVPPPPSAGAFVPPKTGGSNQNFVPRSC